MAAGGALALWVTRTFIQQQDVSADLWLDFWSALVILVVMGLGMLFVLRYGQVALIVLSAGVGPALIVRGLSLPLDSPIISALALAAGIAGLVVQYHDYLVDLRAAHREAEAEGMTSDSTSGEVTVAPQTAI